MILNKGINTYFNGALYNYFDINIGLLSNSLNYGTAIIDSIRFYKKDNNFFSIGIDLYINRFLNTIELRGFKIKESKNDIIKILKVLLYKNKNLEYPYVRLIAYIGDDNLNILNSRINFGIIIFNLKVNTIDLVADFSTFLRENNNFNGLKLSSNYSRNIIEQNKFKKDNIDIVIFIGENNEILECLSENIFCIKNKKIYTPKLGNILNGINRQITILLLRKKGFNVIEKNIYIEDIIDMDEIFITGTATGIRNIKKIGNYIIGEGVNYSILNELKEFFKKDLFNLKSLDYIKIIKII